MSTEVEVNNVIDIQNKIDDMLNLQQDLNDYTNGLGWEAGSNKYGKTINWFRCINLEVAEAIESTPWKHWKAVNGIVDWDNMHIELVDVMHFLLSQLLVEYTKYEANKINIINSSISTLDIVNSINKYNQVVDKDVTQLLKQLERLQLFSLLNDVETRNDIGMIDTQDDKILGYMIRIFFEACMYANLSFDELHSMYIMKATLNKFRQDNGYANGTYVKLWDGKEDNIVCKDLWNRLSAENKNSQNLYSSLSAIYATLDI